MALASRRSPLSGGTHRRSLLYSDLASPSSPSPSSVPRGRTIPSDLPPPPAFTLDDRSGFSPESPPSEHLVPPSPSPTPTPLLSFRTPSHSDSKGKAPLVPSSPPAEIPSTATWWSPSAKDDSSMSPAREGSPVDGVVVDPTALVVLPPPREVARPETPPRPVAPPGALEEEWVTVYGFSPADTNLVLRELEKCGPILQHVLGPRDANWMHILYQTRYDAQKALQKNGVQLNSVLMVGVKPVDPMQRRFLEEKVGETNGGFLLSFPPTLVKERTPFAGELKPSTRIFQATAGGGGGGIVDGGRRTDGAIATPTRSIFSKAMDMVFGL